MLKELHDRLMANRPGDAVHDPDDCPFCGEVAEAITEAEEVSVSYTEEELKTKVDEAIAAATKELLAKVQELESVKNAKETEAKDLQAKVEELEGVKSASEVEAKIAEAKAEMETKVSEIQAQLDTAVLEGEKAKTELAEVVAWLEAEAKAQEQQAQLASRRDERLAKVAEVASFPKEYVESNADRWASLDDDQFAALLEDYKAVGAKKEEAGERKLPAASALTASRETTKGSSALAEVIRGFRVQGIDPRTL